MHHLFFFKIYSDLALEEKLNYRNHNFKIESKDHQINHFFKSYLNIKFLYNMVIFIKNLLIRSSSLHSGEELFRDLESDKW